LAKASALAFVSYSRTDFDFAHRLVQDLKAHGASVWLDKMDIIAGERWDSAVEHALTNAPVMLVILSATSVNSTNVMDEVSFALENRKTVIPIISQECAVPFRLRRLQHVDFRANYTEALSELLRALDPQHERPESRPGTAEAHETVEPPPKRVPPPPPPPPPIPRTSSAPSKIHLVMSGIFYQVPDIPLSIELDGREVGLGSMRKGVDLWLNIQAGNHQLAMKKHFNQVAAASMKVMPSIYADRATSASQEIRVPGGGCYEIRASVSHMTSFISIDPTLRIIPT
jgi:hypothetical protein